MQRNDRLFTITQLLRDGAVLRARDIAARLNVTPRTIYRDVEALQRSGVPIQGTRGSGYRMTDPVMLPPLNLSLDELEALHLGLAVVGEAAEEQLRSAAQSLSAKIDAVLPQDSEDAQVPWGVAPHALSEASRGFSHLPQIRAAIRASQKIEVTHRDADGTLARRTLRPLGLDYWGRVWTLTAWCELCNGFRVFRVDRITELQMMPALFVNEPGKTIADFRNSTRSGTTRR